MDIIARALAIMARETEKLSDVGDIPAYVSGKVLGIDDSGVPAWVNATSVELNYPQVETYADLPATGTTNEIYIVNTTTGVIGFRKLAGFYYYNGSAWTYLGAGDWVNLSGDQTVGGIKTFTSTPNINGDNLVITTDTRLSDSRTPTAHTQAFSTITDTPTTLEGYGIALESTDIPGLGWSKITSGKPTTVAGYGITDVYTKAQGDTKYAPKDNPTFTGNVSIGNSDSFINGYNSLIVNGNTYGGSILVKNGASIGSSGYFAGGFNIGTRSADDLVLMTNLATRVHIKYDGNIGLGGVTDPQATLHSTGTTIVGVANGSTWAMLGNNQMIPQVTGNILSFLWKDASGVQHTYSVTATS